MLTINVISTETRIKGSWFHGMRVSDYYEVLKISRPTVCDQQKLSPTVCLYPYKPSDHLCVPLSRAEIETVINYYKKELETKFKKCSVCSLHQQYKKYLGVSICYI